MTFNLGRSRKANAKYLLLGEDKLVEQETVNAYKTAMMYRAMAKFTTLNQILINEKVLRFQRDEIQKHEIRDEQQNAKKNKVLDDDIEFQCARCSKVACMASDIRKYHQNHHLVADINFPSRYTTKSLKSSAKYDSLENKFLMFCGDCPAEWGTIADCKGVELRMLKCKCLKFKSVRTQETTEYKAWNDVPYKFKDVTLEDIPKVFGSI